MIGIIVIQSLWIRNALIENRKQFDAIVQTMLSRISARFERQESLMTYTASMQVRQSFSVMQPGIDSINWLIDSLKRSKHKFDQQVHKNTDFESRKDYLSIEATIKELEEMSASRNNQMRHVSEWLQFEYRLRKIPLSDRLMIGDLPGIIAHEQTINNLNIPIEYAVYEPNKKKTVYSSENFFSESGAEQYQIDLYPSALMEQSPLLMVKFPNRGKILIQSLRWLLLASIVFLVFIISAFYKTVSLIIGQKKVADVKNDFINNMTHEFKTPIATINLATDALNSVMKSHQIPENAFTSIIKQESARMHRHIERILQIAILERDEVVLKPEKMDIIPIINRIIQSFELRIKEFSGDLTFHCKESEIYCNIDEDHFINSIYNLLDNSLKYNDKRPIIEIKAYIKEGIVFIDVCDNGIGMSKETTKKVFEKFYRASTGNTHNVKGFGLGLSYVKLVIEIMKGSLNIESQLGEGSTFTIQLPQQLTS